MAASRVVNIHNYVGTTVEMAALSLTGVPQGSHFFASDTGWDYYLVGTSWIKKLYPAT